MEGFVANLPFFNDERNDLTVIVDALTKKNTIRGRAARLSDSMGRILEVTPQGNADKSLRPDCYLPGFQLPVRTVQETVCCING